MNLETFSWKIAGDLSISGEEMAVRKTTERRERGWEKFTVMLVIMPSKIYDIIVRQGGHDV